MKTLIVQEDVQVLNIILNRPDRHNAFNADMIDELTGVFRAAATNSKWRCVLLKGEGKSFCSGADLDWMKSMVHYSLEENISDAEKLLQMFSTIRDCEIPILARVQGNVMGGGIGLLSVCDIVASEQDARFCFSEVKLGLVPSVISTFVLRKCVANLSRELMLTAEMFDAKIARELGLTNFCGDPEEVDDFLQSKMDFICSNGPEAMRVTKRLLSNFEDQKDLKESVRIIAQKRVSTEGQEGLRAFLEKRKPSWK